MIFFDALVAGAHGRLTDLHPIRHDNVRDAPLRTVSSHSIGRNASVLDACSLMFLKSLFCLLTGKGPSDELQGHGSYGNYHS